MGYVADARHPKEPPYQIWTQYDTRQSELLTYYSCCHGNIVTIATRYVADAYHSKEPPCQIWIQYDTRQHELLTYHCGCYGNLVTIATRYVADAILPIVF